MEILDCDDNCKKMSYDEADSKPQNRLGKEEESYNKALYKLVCVMIISSAFIALQMVVGKISGSIAIYTVIAHLAADMIGFSVSMYALKAQQQHILKPLSSKWARAEIIGSLMSAIFLTIITTWLVFTAIQRVINPVEVKGFEMMVQAVNAICFNLVQMCFFDQGDIHFHMGGEIGETDQSSSNYQQTSGQKKEVKAPLLSSYQQQGNRYIKFDAACLYALGDMLTTAGVFVAALIIYFKPELTLVDPICTLIFSVLVLCTVIPIGTNSMCVLMKSGPSEINIDNMIKQIKSETAAKDVYDFNLQQQSVGKYAFSCHIDSSSPKQTLEQVTHICQTRFNIDQVTIQMEDKSSGQNDNALNN